MAKRKSVEDLYQAIFSIRETLQDTIQMASEVSVIADAFGGEIARVITEQINKYFIPSITKFIDDKETPGAMAPLVTFLDSVPLAMTREEPSPEQTTPNPINTQLAAPPSGPAPESFAGQTAVQQEKVAIMPKGSQSLKESASSPFEFKARSLKQSSPIMEAASQRVGTKIFEAMEMWSVYRISPRGDKSLIASNLTEAEAKLRCSRLNEGLTDIDIFKYEARKSETMKVGVKKPCPKKVTESKTTLEAWLDDDDSTTEDLSAAQKNTLFDLANSGDFEEEDLQEFLDDPTLLDV